MNRFSKFLFKDPVLVISVFFLITTGTIILVSLDKSLFPLYFLYILLGILAFYIFSAVDFDVISVFSRHFYVISVILLAVTLVFGRVTRNTVRWIQIGAGSFQPAELVRPFLLVFFANYLGKGEVNLRKFLKSIGLLLIPVVLILVQPSLGVSILTVVAFIGVLLASKFNKRYLLFGIIAALLLAPLAWSLMAPYQKERVLTFIDPGKDPRGAGYNSIQATIAAGSGGVFGKGLGKGTQTQLAFLPEKKTDFIFSSTAEELGLIGAGLILIASFLILIRITVFMEHSVSPSSRAYLSGFFLAFLAQIFVHVGMNLGILPVTGIPFPLVSAGGSSLLATMVGLGICLGAYRKN